MATPTQTSASGLLVVEGQNDQNAILHLCRQGQPGLAERFTIHDAKGFQGVINSIRGFINQDGITAVGFIVDADDDPQARWRQVLNRIADADNRIALPASLDSNGAIIPENADADIPRIGVWIMPDNLSGGELEDFVSRMVPADDPVWPRAQDYIVQIPQPRKFNDDKITKAKVHAWLSTRKFPGLIGLAIREGDLNTAGRLAQTFLAWLSRLFT